MTCRGKKSMSQNRDMGRAQFFCSFEKQYYLGDKKYLSAIGKYFSTVRHEALMLEVCGRRIFFMPGLSSQGAG
jgi:hypothetical protein